MEVNATTCYWGVAGGGAVVLYGELLLCHMSPACPAFINVLLWTTNKVGCSSFSFFFFFLYIEILAKFNKNLAKSVEFTTQKIPTNKLGIFLVILRDFHKIEKRKRKKERTVNKFIAAS